MSADWWQNFANNFAADLAPLISLFGESPTKQYLSETLTFLDIFIFSMAPIGVITALVSAIRVAGGPSLRAFIGRAQEGAGIAEVELCSSTSRNVCELYNNGGIARVFGRPKILEFVHDWKRDITPDQQEQKFHDKAGIYSFREYLALGHWEEKGTRPSSKEVPDNEKGTKPTYHRSDFAPHPNLSLNVGITKHHIAWYYLAAILGFTLQAGVIAFAALVTYKYPRGFQRDDTQIAVPAFPFICGGTFLLCVGVGMCAFIIEKSTYERTFKRKDDHPSRLYWVQPGDQVVGDQVFDCFAYSDAKDQIREYTTSKREIERGNDTKQFLPRQSMYIWAATATTTIGFVLQFLGLRTVHSTVSVAQLGAMLIMSMVRALLRTRHLKQEHNLLGDSSALYLHHELDWLAIEMALENEEDPARSWLSLNRLLGPPFWCITGPDKIPPLSIPQQRSMYGESKRIAAKAYLKRVKLAQMTGAQTLASTLIIDDPWEDVMVSSRVWASKLASAIEGVMGVIDRRCTVKSTLPQDLIPWSLRCWMGRVESLSGRKFNLSNDTIQLTISHETEGTGLHGPWKTDRAQLESVLGLWLWSIISVQRIRQVDEKDPSGSNNSVHRASRLIYVSEKSDSSEANLRLWLGSRSTRLQAAKLKLVGATFRPSSLWVDKNGENVYSQVSEYDFPKRRHPTTRRIFGSNVVTTGILDEIEGQLVRVLHLPSASSLEMMCAQELFTIFFHTVIPEIEAIRGNTEIVEGPHRYYVANSTLSEMIESFTSSGIGNYDDAIACMIPVLLTSHKLNYSGVFMAARVAGEEYYQRREWGKAENALLSALKAAIQDLEFVTVISLPGDTDRTKEIQICLLRLCELYRWALLGDKRTRLFGLRGFLSLCKLFHNRPTGSGVSTDNQGKIPEDLLMYLHVALNLTKEEKDNRDILHAIQELREQMVGPYVEIFGDFYGALHQANLTEALYALEYSIFGTFTGRPVLAKAAQHGWYPIMKSLKGHGIDTREVDHNGLNYLHYASQSCNAPMFNDLIGDDIDLLQHTDNFGRTHLHLAAASGRTDVVKILTQHLSAKTNSRDHFLRSALDNAILSDQLDAFTLLSTLEKEDDSEPPPGDSWELEIKWLFQATCCCSTKIVRGLLATIINSNIFDGLGTAKLQMLEIKKYLGTNEAENSQNCIKILESLRELNYLAEDWQIKGRGAISFAAEAGNADLVVYLLQRCAKDSIVAMDNSGRTCLHHAVISESESAVKALIESRYSNDLIVKDRENLDPLDYALKQKSFAMASILLEKVPRGQSLILPGTAIAEQTGSIYFQGTDARIRQVALYSHPKRSGLSVAPPVSARLYTPLAVLEKGHEHQIFYVSKENILSDLLYDHSGNWIEGSFRKNVIRVHAKSSLATSTAKGRCYVHYQDEQRNIRAIDSDDSLGNLVVPFPAIGKAAEGSAIVGVHNSFQAILYFQNRFLEIEEATGPFSGDTIHEPDLEPLTPLVPWYKENKILCCDNKGHIRAISQNAMRLGCSGPWNIESVGGSQTRLAVDQLGGKLIFQSKLGDIRAAKIGGQDLAGDVLVASKQDSEGISPGKTVLLWDENSSRYVFGSSLYSPSAVTMAMEERPSEEWRAPINSPFPRPSFS